MNLTQPGFADTWNSLEYPSSPFSVFFLIASSILASYWETHFSIGWVCRGLCKFLESPVSPACKVSTPRTHSCWHRASASPHPYDFSEYCFVTQPCHLMFSKTLSCCLTKNLISAMIWQHSAIRSSLVRKCRAVGCLSESLLGISALSPLKRDARATRPVGGSCLSWMVILGPSGPPALRAHPQTLLSPCREHFPR